MTPLPSFALRVVHDDRRTAIAPEGELDVATVPELERAIAEATRQPGAELVLDLRKLTFMDSTGLCSLAQANSGAQERDYRLSIVRGSPEINRVLEISGLAPMLPLIDSPPD